jgi:hypothetical protein
MTQESQNSKILAYLLTGKRLTAIEALNMFGTFRLAARINDLKRNGLNIQTEIIEKNKKRFAEYYLVQDLKLFNL